MALLIVFPRTYIDLLTFESQGHDALLQHIADCQHERHEVQRRNAATYTDERALALSSAALGSLRLANASVHARMKSLQGLEHMLHGSGQGDHLSRTPLIGHAATHLTDRIGRGTEDDAAVPHAKQGGKHARHIENL